MARVGLLTTRSHPLLPAFLELLTQKGFNKVVLLFDARDFSDKDRRLFSERTMGRIALTPIEPWLERFESYTVPDHNSPESLTRISALGLELLVNAGTPRRVGEALLAAAPRGVLNAHPGLLPRYRGASCCEWAIYNNDPVGVTAHFMDAGIDTGPILFSEALPVSASDSYIDIRVALYHLAHQVRLKAMQQVMKHNLTAADGTAQPEGGRFDPIPDALFASVKQKVASGEYAASLTRTAA